MENLNKAKQLVQEAEAVVVVAGNGLAKVEGLDLLGQADFERDFPSVAQKYDVHSVGYALDQHIPSWSEKWQLWSSLIQKYSFDYRPSSTLKNLLQLISHRQYFVATSAFGHFFETAGFNENRIFNAFGDWTKAQCASGINHGLANIQTAAEKIIAAKPGTDLAKLVPKCEVCGQPLEIHLPLNDHFYPDTVANSRFRWFLTGNEEKKTVFLELGVDETSPQLREPIEHLVAEYPQWSYVAADYPQETLLPEIQERSAGTNADTVSLINHLVTE
ncbi:Sir2 family NAD-dependent protein deacetylase [Lactobacillus sp. ESL0260]|uniref:Sir2 family NAD-dependent protein deacetylase n=1 Tax=Lactobacillus sp. ESL0260 TaxID=2069347 RepID=UPI000EFB3337|nr:Sir2 family NAD-dependent protein deacetylase [Lactobacillus sp. ESL0260]RMC60170.1 Sir2 family NAD-dependent protein deacetylase [Lactobacillus sp. ESL0260]